MSAFVRAVWRKPVWGWFSGRAVRRGRGERGAIVFCVMYNSPSSLGSRVGSSGPPSVPVISVAVARGTIYPTLHCHDILETLLSLPRFSFPRCAQLSLSRKKEKEEKERERDSFSRFRVSSHRGAATPLFSPRLLVAQHYSPAAHIHPFSSHIPFLLAFPSVNFACQKVLCSRVGGVGEAKKGHVSERSNNVT